MGRRSKREGGKKNHTHTHTPSILQSLFLSLLHAASPAEDLHRSNKPKNHCCNYCQSLLVFFFQQQLEGGRQGGEGSPSSFLPSQVVPPFILCIGGANLLVFVVQAGGGGEGRGGQETYGLVMSGGRCDILQRHVKKNPTGSCLLLLPLSLLPSLTACLSCFQAHGLTHRLSRKNGSLPSRVLSLSHARARSLLSVCLCLSSLCSCVCLLFLWLRCRNYGKGPIRDPDPTRRRKNFTSSRSREQKQQLPSERVRMDPLATYSS